MPVRRHVLPLLAPLAAFALAGPALASATVPLPYLDPPDVRTQRDVAKPTPTPRPERAIEGKRGASNDWSPTRDLGSAPAPRTEDRKPPASEVPTPPERPTAPPTVAPATPAPATPTPSPTLAPPSPPSPSAGDAPLLPPPSLAPTP